MINRNLPSVTRLDLPYCTKHRARTLQCCAKQSGSLINSAQQQLGHIDCQRPTVQLVWQNNAALYDQRKWLGMGK